MRCLRHHIIKGQLLAVSMRSSQSKPRCGARGVGGVAVFCLQSTICHTQIAKTCPHEWLCSLWQAAGCVPWPTSCRLWLQSMQEGWLNPRICRPVQAPLKLSSPGTDRAGCCSRRPAWAIRKPQRIWQRQGPVCIRHGSQ